MTQAKVRLHVSGETAGRIVAGAGAAKTEQVHAVHLDTPDHELFQRNASLRIRHLPDRQVQTIRTLDGDRDTLLDGDVPIVDAASAWAAFRPPA